MNFPSEKDDCKKFKKNNVAIALNDIYAKTEKTIQIVKSKLLFLLC